MPLVAWASALSSATTTQVFVYSKEWCIGQCCPFVSSNSHCRSKYSAITTTTESTAAMVMTIKLCFNCRSVIVLLLSLSLQILIQESKMILLYVRHCLRRKHLKEAIFKLLDIESMTYKMQSRTGRHDKHDVSFVT